MHLPLAYLHPLLALFKRELEFWYFLFIHPCLTEPSCSHLSSEGLLLHERHKQSVTEQEAVKGRCWKVGPSLSVMLSLNPFMIQYEGEKSQKTWDLPIRAWKFWKVKQFCYDYYTLRLFKMLLVTLDKFSVKLLLKREFSRQLIIFQRFFYPI